MVKIFSLYLTGWARKNSSGFFKEQFSDPSKIFFPIQTTQIAIPPALFIIKKFVETYLEGTHGIQSVFEVGKTQETEDPSPANDT